MSAVLNEVLDIVQNGGGAGIMTDNVNAFHHIPVVEAARPPRASNMVKVVSSPESQEYLEIKPEALEHWWQAKLSGSH